METVNVFTKQEIQTAKQNGISYHTLYMRVESYGWDIEKAITEPTKMKRVNVLTEQEIQTAKENGISYITLYMRVENYGWDLEQAITTPTKGRFGNNTPIFTKEELSIAESNGVTYSALANRMRRGWDKQAALTKPPKVKVNRVKMHS
jgi:hypothetical protein